MSLVKILIFLPSVWLFNVSCIPTNPPPNKSERMHEPIFERICVNTLPVVCKVVASIAYIAEVAVTLAAHYPSPLSSEVLSRLAPSGQLPSAHIDHYFLTGSALSIVGGLGRLWCFHILGRRFTAELAVRKDHKLVTTGPYSIVRHPSYSCAILSQIGMLLMISGPGSFAERCGWLATSGRLIIAVIIVPLWLVACARCPREDAFLRERFQKEWDEYSRRVIYRMIPGVY